LARTVDTLLADWAKVAAEQTANGGAFPYTGHSNRLLHLPLDPVLPNLPPEHQKFMAGRSMRDVEMNVRLKVKDPIGQSIAGAQDT
jgi:hypothetical protein